MSSIYGILSFSQFKPTHLFANKIDDITGWWKPDKRFYLLEDNLLLGQQDLYSHRYSNLENKSIFDHPSGYKIISDTRIDNRSDLLTELSLGDNISNSELILHLYHKHKEDCFSKLVGAFAVVIWDSKDHKLICARDQIGVKPFLYYHKKGLFAFGTQKKSITAIDETEKTPDWRYILNSISNLGLESHTTEYAEIKHLPPGHILLVKDNSLTLKKYWEPDINNKIVYKNDSEYIDEFLFIFRQAITCRMSSIGTTATHLSGGLDSSGITSVAHEIATQNNWKQKILSYNITDDYNGDPKRVEENLGAFELVSFLDLNSSFTNVNTPIKRSIMTKVRHEVLCCDGGSRSNNVNTEYEIQAEAAKLNTKVLLSGFPGDELVTSFCRPFYLEHFERGNWIKYFTDKKKSRHNFKDRLKAFMPALLVKTMPFMQDFMSEKYTTRRYKSKKYNFNYIFLNNDYFNASPELKEFLEPKYYPMVHHDFPSSLRQYQKNHICRPHTYMRMESEQLAGKYWHTEYRYPMADIRLIQFMLSIPMEQKISKDMSRRMFRLSMKNYIPDSIRLRDVKTAGSLKPMVDIRHNPIKREAYDFIQELKESNKVPFLNLDVAEKWIVGKKNNVFSLYPWLVIAQLAYTDKLKFH